MTLDARQRGHDMENSPTAQLVNFLPEYGSKRTLCQDTDQHPHQMEKLPGHRVTRGLKPFTIQSFFVMRLL
jgi:hypothetical protein